MRDAGISGIRSDGPPTPQCGHRRLRREGRNGAAGGDSCPVRAVQGVAERIRLSFENEAMEFDGQEIGATVSMGMAICDDGAFDMSGLLAQADEALYCAKDKGRNRTEIAPDRPAKPAFRSSRAA